MEAWKRNLLAGVIGVFCCALIFYTIISAFDSPEELRGLDLLLLLVFIWAHTASFSVSSPKPRIAFCGWAMLVPFGVVTYSLNIISWAEVFDNFLPETWAVFLSHVLMFLPLAIGMLMGGKFIKLENTNTRLQIMRFLKAYLAVIAIYYLLL